MKFGINLPNHGELAGPKLVTELAVVAEDAGWDGFFIWDHVMRGNQPVADTWLTLAAVACNTRRMRIGPMITPLPRRNPWEVARQAVTLDHLSGGRLILGVGAGDDSLREYSAFGDTSDGRERAERLEEALQVITGLWQGGRFDYDGRHFQVDDVRFLPQPYQAPRIPIWLAGTWPLKRPFKRAAGWDGVVPVKRGGPVQPEDVVEIRKFITEVRQDGLPFDLVVIHWANAEARLDGMDQASEFARADATWHLTSLSAEDEPDALFKMVERGPPVVSSR